MRVTIISCLMAALYSASFVLADALQEPAGAVLEDRGAAPEPFDADLAKIIARQGGATEVVAVTTTNAAQYPTVTTQWIESTIASTTTWVEVIYTQTFAAVPDQWTTAGAGSIGYGTLKSKRDIAARETGYAQPIVMAIQQEVVTHYIRPVTEVLIIDTFTILPNMTYNGTHGSSNSTVNGTFGGGNMTYNATSIKTFGNATAAGRVFTFPASLDPMAHHLPTGTSGTVVY